MKIIEYTVIWYIVTNLRYSVFFWTAILQKKIGRSPLVIKEYIEEYDVDALLSDNAELLLKFIPTETEVRVQRHLGHSGTVGIAYQLQLFGPFRQSSEKHVFRALPGRPETVWLDCIYISNDISKLSPKILE